MSKIGTYTEGTYANNQNMILIAVAVLAFLLIVGFVINVYIPFSEERKQIKAEMARSVGRKEYLYWKRKLKKLYLSKIPFIRLFVKRK